METQPWLVIGIALVFFVFVSCKCTRRHHRIYPRRRDTVIDVAAIALPSCLHGRCKTGHLMIDQAK